MAKQIKVIKCPQCGNAKPLTIGTDHYRCDKCGTDFFLDNDDVNVNVNVNHRYEATNNNTSPMKGVWITVAVVFIVGLMLVTKFCVDQVSRAARNATTHTVTERPNNVQHSKYFFSILLPVNGQGVAFYITSRDKKTYARFLDVATGNVIMEQEMALEIARNQNIEYRYFLSDGRHYVIINGNLIYNIEPGNHVFTDITAEICARKPALEAGLMAISFVTKEQGEGFRIHTNLGKDLYYFPKTDMLYTEKAFRYVAEDISKPLLPGAKDLIYYLFLNKESAHSSNVAQLFEIKCKFNNGGPENRLMQINEFAMKNLDKYRITSCKSITDERIYFSPEVLFFDNHNILIAYQPSLAQDAGSNMQLLDTSGNIIWTKQFKGNQLQSTFTIRTNSGFMLQASETDFCEISADGQHVQKFKIP